ncbi:MAG: hypothetical protein JNL45_01680 [Hyphomicrobium sp.]|nr:hypothetical protein [Hyphomicrobium sp.]
MLDARVLAALDGLARERGVTVNELADDALRAYLKKHARPVTLRDALTQSARIIAANDPGRGRRKT